MRVYFFVKDKLITPSEQIYLGNIDRKINTYLMVLIIISIFNKKQSKMLYLFGHTSYKTRSY